MHYALLTQTPVSLPVIAAFFSSTSEPAGQLHECAESHVDEGTHQATVPTRHEQTHAHMLTLARAASKDRCLSQDLRKFYMSIEYRKFQYTGGKCNSRAK